MFENTESLNIHTENPEKSSHVKKYANEFLNGKNELLSEGDIENVLYFAENEFKPLLENSLSQKESSNEVVYDKYKKSFSVRGQKITPGEIIASRHFTNDICIPPLVQQHGAGKQVFEKYLNSKTNDIVSEELNRQLAHKLVEVTQKKDALKSKAYSEIEKRSGKDTEQLGVVAEKLMIGVAEMISINRPDLHIFIRPGNAFEDVEEKIDFVIDVRSKKRGVEIETSNDSFDEKHFGIQFTINTSKNQSKMDQIEKAKLRGTEMDDILLVTMEQELLKKALHTWKEKGSPLHGPWAEFPKESQNKIIRGLFENILTEVELESLTK